MAKGFNNFHSLLDKAKILANTTAILTQRGQATGELKSEAKSLSDRVRPTVHPMDTANSSLNEKKTGKFPDKRSLR